MTQEIIVLWDCGKPQEQKFKTLEEAAIFLNVILPALAVKEEYAYFDIYAFMDNMPIDLSVLDSIYSTMGC